MVKSGKKLYRVLTLALAIGFIIAAASTIMSNQELSQINYIGSEKCGMCHRELYENWTKSRHGIIDEMGWSESTTGCETCHGPGEKHMQNAGDVNFIVNPANGKAEMVETICAKCHFDTSAQAPEAWRFFKMKNWKKAKHSKKNVSCLSCHSLHGEENHAKLLKSETGELCNSCHSDTTIPKDGGAFQHMPVKAGMCVKCHEPHGSSERHMVKENIFEVCSQCHNTSSEKIMKGHQGYSMEGKKCTKCHDPHSSNIGNHLIGEYAHQPFEARNCELCHEGKDSETPLALKAPQEELCMKCHSADYEKFIKGGKNVHYPVEKKFCTGCHTPHASKYKEMTNDRLDVTCFGCHAQIEDDTIKQYPHEPVDKGNCLACHSVKSSDNAKLMNMPLNERCISCHATQGVQTHPMGEALKTPDTKREVQEINCASCHFVHGSDFEYILIGGRSEFCSKCHSF